MIDHLASHLVRISFSRPRSVRTILFIYHSGGFFEAKVVGNSAIVRVLSSQRFQACTCRLLLAKSNQLVYLLGVFLWVLT